MGDMKTEYAKHCQVAWPCRSTTPSGVQELSNGPVHMLQSCHLLDLGSCPLTWRAKGDGMCLPPQSLPGPCAQAVQLSAMRHEEKLEWAGRCLLAWSCKDDLE